MNREQIRHRLFDEVIPVGEKAIDDCWDPETLKEAEKEFKRLGEKAGEKASGAKWSAFYASVE